MSQSFCIFPFCSNFILLVPKILAFEVKFESLLSFSWFLVFSANWVFKNLVKMVFFVGLLIFLMICQMWIVFCLFPCVLNVFLGILRDWAEFIRKFYAFLIYEVFGTLKMGFLVQILLHWGKVWIFIVLFMVCCVFCNLGLSRIL